MTSKLLSERLMAVSPLRNPELIAAIERYERLGIPELDQAWLDVNDAFREWVEAPENVDRADPGGAAVLGPHRDRIAPGAPDLVGVAAAG